ncbi:MAG TPA: hypothetical protein VMJ34_06360 [Bryobacteraceae bacterium]|nr:hypothetical protein [Bryobacteraceae bacterium]
MRSVALLGLLLLGFSGVLGDEKPVTTAGVGDIRMRANQMTRTNDMLMLSGDVMVTMSGVTVYADQAQYDVATGDLMPQGHVRIHTERLRDPRAFQLDPSDTPLRMPDNSPWPGK